MCGALGAKRAPDEELAFAGRLINAVVAGLPRDRVALHVCRGNWSRDEARGPDRAVHPARAAVHERCRSGRSSWKWPRRGPASWQPSRDLPADSRVGLGVVNQKLDRVESVEEIVARAEAAVALFGPDRVLLNPDCGFATFADNPLASAQVAEAKLAAIVQAAQLCAASMASPSRNESTICLLL